MALSLPLFLFGNYSLSTEPRLFTNSQIKQKSTAVCLELRVPEMAGPLLLPEPLNTTGQVIGD